MLQILNKKRIVYHKTFINSKRTAKHATKMLSEADGEPQWRCNCEQSLISGGRLLCAYRSISGKIDVSG